MAKYNIKIDLEKYTNLRRAFHRIPEIGYKEYKTKKLILENLNNLKNFSEYGKLKEILETGFYIDIYGRGDKSKDYENRFISLRADIDGLPFQEDTGVEYTSEHKNMIHGCGHDGHIVILIATIEYYLEHIDKIPSNFGVRFLFQPAEEGLGGAAKMIEGGCLESVQEIYGLHNVPIFNVGEIGVIPGTIMARIDVFNIHIEGQGGHGSQPHRCHNPINTGVQIINAINQLSSQEIDSKERHVITVGCFQSGEACNVIPQIGIIKGTVRTIKDEVGEKIINRLTELSTGIAKLNSSESKLEHNEVGQCTDNHKDPTEVVEKIVSKYFSLQTHDLPVMASEDFSYYQKVIPGCFFMLGAADETHTAFLHTTKFDFNDKAIPYGIEMFIRIVEIKAHTTFI